MVNIILILFLGYFVLLILLMEGWRKTIRNAKLPTTLNSKTPFISVLIPIRNEKENIDKILSSIAIQSYPVSNFEILVINDHSEDGTESILEKWRKENPLVGIRIINLAEKITGKKAALTEGVKQAKGEIIVTTDADCHVKSTWLSSTVRVFDNHIHLAPGPVKLQDNKTIFGSMQMLEFVALVGTGASTLAWEIPTMCNGANLAYRKEAFIEVNGYEGNEHIPSGDDEFLLRKIGKRYPNGVRFNANEENIVSVNASVSLKEFIYQRIRWAGKWAGHGAGVSPGIALFIFLFHCTVLSLLPMAVLGSIGLPDILLLMGAKILIEGVFLLRVTKFLSIPFRPISFFMLQFVYSFYVLFIALATFFMKPAWKGRKIGRQTM